MTQLDKCSLVSGAAVLAWTIIISSPCAKCKHTPHAVTPSTKQKVSRCIPWLYTASTLHMQPGNSTLVLLIKTRHKARPGQGARQGEDKGDLLLVGGGGSSEQDAGGHHVARHDVDQRVWPPAHILNQPHGCNPLQHTQVEHQLGQQCAKGYRAHSTNRFANDNYTLCRDGHGCAVGQTYPRAKFSAAL